MKILSKGLICFALLLSTAAHATPYSTAELGTTELQIHQKFPGIIEKNLTSARVQKVLVSLTNQEMSDLGLAYKRNTGGNTYKLDAIITGYADVNQRLRWGKAKAGTLVGTTLPTPPPPSCLGKPGCKKYDDKAILRVMAAGPLLDFTFHEIYLDFRTAPGGALGPSSALFETVNFIATRSLLAYSVGYATGTVAAKLMDRYAPNVYDAIGGTIQAAMDNISNALTIPKQGMETIGLGRKFGYQDPAWGPTGSLGSIGSGIGDFGSLAAGSYSFSTGYSSGGTYYGGSWGGTFTQFMDVKDN